MSRQAIALEFDAIATAIEQLPGVSRRHPERFLEAKSEIEHRCARRAAEMRAAPGAATIFSLPGNGA